MIGGGNTAVEEALFLSKFASKVILVHRRDKLRAEKLLQQRLLANDKIEIKWNHVLYEVLGEDQPHKSVTGVKLQNVQDNSFEKLSVDGVFIAIGHSPSTQVFKGHIDMDKSGYIICHDGVNTNVKGVFAAGDVHDKVYRQAVTAAGFGCMAALDAEKFLNEDT